MDTPQDPRQAAQDELVSDLLHNLRTPLTVIIGSANQALLGGTREKRMSPEIERIRRCAINCRSILDRFARRMQETPSPELP